LTDAMGGGDDDDDDDRWGDGHSHACREIPLSNYRLRKKSLNVWTSDSELLPAVALDVVSFCAARSGDDDDGDGRANISEARSSYAAWVSRGCWPKRPKAHGAAVDVGNREKGACTLEEEDILVRAC